MKRALLLLVMVPLVAWLAQGSSANYKRQPAALAPALNAAPAAPAALPNAPLPQDSCCADPNQTDPHYECFSGACYQVSGCGTSVDCASCGCSPDDEWTCLNNGGSWDSYSCTCEYSCDPYGTQQQSCLSEGGYWDAYNCICDYGTGCDPTGSQRQACLDAGRQWSDISCTCGDTDVCVCEDEEMVGYDEYSYGYCDGYYYYYCTDTYYDYYQYCDGTCGPRSWTEEYTDCYPADYCGDWGGGGGGGGGSCWDTGDCWCDDWWGVCCEYDYCYEEDEYLY